MITVTQQLLNSGSKLLNVNGTTPQTFSFSPGTGTVSVIGLSCILKENSATSFTSFGALSALTNGVVIQWSISGNTKNYVTIKDNADLTQAFPHHQHFGNSAVLSIISIITPQGFGNTNNVMRGTVYFNNSIILNNSDSVSAIIQDNLSAVSVFQMSVIYEQDF